MPCEGGACREALPPPPSQECMSAIKSLVAPRTPHATLQRVLLAGMAGRALLELLPAAGSTPPLRKALLLLPTRELVIKVRRGALLLGPNQRGYGFFRPRTK